ncbi:immunity protein 30 of polymorphic toxin system [Pedobacter psychrotolerans]|uniref:Immunity protein 30 of polymorphic toxin system n=1 Tax=Pedobacter psychrotolerans TaxID=1843235 RepID=A0A4R2H8B7_9SPHI|nr:Imm30 family immunity protein [Pedobacter psychrotolerans]TCO20675.1 immunity protein 30 of polymorphic toxin system [Pedobacter psychrotolerans]GGE67231.1 hypothetical protein GCM10011413_37350 [Pedobacter psychrotolerans]
MEIKQLESQLIENKLMRTYEETGLYEEAVDELFNENNPECINSLIKGFSDATENEEVMFSNLHGIEYFSKTLGLETYIKIILPKLKEMQVDAYGWAETFFLRLLNNDAALDALIRNVEYLSQENKIFIRKMVENLSERNPERFKNKGDIIISKL